MKRKMLVIVAMISMIFSLSVVSAKEVEVNDAATLLAAFKNAESGDVVKLIDNITYAGSGIMVEGKKTVTLDMNGFNITIDPTINEKDEQGQYRSITVNDSTLIIKGKGTITHETHSAINVWGKETEDAEFASKLVVEKDVTLKGKQGIAIFWDTKMGAHGVTVDFGGKIEATVHGITIQGIIKNAEGAPVINILDGAVINSEQTGLYAAGNGTWNIGKANITGKESAIGIKSGKVIINGGTFTCTGESQMPTEGYSNGINASGAALQLESNKDYYGNIELIIKDGTFTSKNAVSIYEYLAKNIKKTNVNKIEILGGKFASARGNNNFLLSEELDYKGAIAVSGGTFSANPVSYLKPAHKVTFSEEKYVVSPINVVEGAFKISGTITNGNNAKVQLIQGGNVLKVVTADDEGKYEFTKVEKGKYNIVFINGNNSTTKLVEVLDKNLKVDAEIKTGSVTVLVGKDTPNVLVDGLDKIDGQIEVIVQKEEKLENNETQNKILAETKNKEILFLNIGIKNNGQTLSNTDNVLHFIISFDALNKEKIELYRYHGQEVNKFTKLDKMPTELKDQTFYIDEANKELHIFTDKFSTYGITYNNVEVINNPVVENPKTFDATFGYILLTLISVLAIASITIYRKKVSVR